MSTALAEVEPPKGAVRDLTAELKKIRGDYRLFATDRCAVCGGPLFDDEDEEEEDKKKKEKSKKKNDEEGTKMKKEKKKKKKGVFKLLHRGKDKAGGLLDGLQYEGDELQRKKAKRQLKRDEREGKLPRAADTVDNSSKGKKSSMERVVSEGRLAAGSSGGADRRGRTKPGRSRTMSSIPSASSTVSAPARIICRHCERGEKRRSWGTVRGEALAAGAPAHRLYAELSEERELMASLLARFDYLVGSVSPDVGDLLIELFTPRLKEETDSEQLRLVMAETRDGDDDDEEEDDDDDDEEKTTTKKKTMTTTKKKKKTKKSRIMGAGSAAAAADKDGPSAKPMGLSLGKIFGWNDKNEKNSTSAAATTAENGGKPKRKVMALLPSCYCPLKNADKYETFFPTFYLEVYQAAEELQKELTMTADTYKAALKLFARLKATTQTARQERIVSNMKIAFVEFIQDKQPEINWLKIKLQSMFVCQASYLFLVLCQLLWEIRKRQSLWLKLGKYCLATIQVMQSELSSLVISFHKDWAEHKQRIEEIITEYNKLKAEKNKALTSGSPAENTGLGDEDLLLNCERIVRECVKQVEFNLGEIGLRATKEALVELVANLVLERAKCHL